MFIESSKHLTFSFCFSAARLGCNQPNPRASGNCRRCRAAEKQKESYAKGGSLYKHATPNGVPGNIQQFNRFNLFNLFTSFNLFNIVIVVLLLTLLRASVQAAAPTLDHLYPVALQIGTSNSMTV